MCFGIIDEQIPKVVDKNPLNNIIKIAIKKTPLISSIIFNVRSKNY